MKLIGRILLGLSYAIFGTLHFIFAQKDINLVPTFVGPPLFWVYFIGICWWATAISFFTNIMTRLSGLLASALLLLILFFVQLKGFDGMASAVSLASTIALIGGSVMVAGEGTMYCCKKKQYK